MNPLYSSHILTTRLQKILLAMGSGFGALVDPTRDEYIATFGETTANQALVHMRRKMLGDPEGSKILKERPLINSRTVDFKYLKSLPAGSFGAAYMDFLETNGVSPDTRKRVHFVDDEELAYVMQRYREVHDLIHTLLGMKTNLLGEIAVKWVEGVQFGLPMCVTAGIFGPIRLKSKHRQLYLSTYLPWALQAGHNSSFLLNVYFEERWHQHIQEMRQELSLPDPPQAAGTNPYDIRLLKSQPDQSNELNKSSKSDCSLQEKVKKWIFDERKPVVIFSKTFCPYCHKVKELFKQLSIDSQVIELDRLPDGQAVQEVLSSISGQESLPNVFIHGNHVGGCDATIKLYEEGKLLPMINITEQQ